MSVDQLIQKIKEKQNPSVAGLDPQISYVPAYMRERAYREYGKTLKGAAEAVWEFNKGLIDALYDVVPAVKPQSAFYELYGLPGEEVLHRTIRYAKEKGLYVILDVKRNDIGSTAQAYSAAYLGKVDIDGEQVEACPVDSVTVNPYLGTDGILPFVQDCKTYGKSMFTLVKTSNPSSGELQDLLLGDARIYEKVAELVCKWGAECMGESGYSSVGAVVGATYPEQAKTLRKLMPKAYFLVPGYGAQGGNAQDVKNSFNDDGLGAIVNSSRGIMCAYKKGDWKEEAFAEAARAEAIRMKEELNSIL
ncbi:MAG TPA: orotidine-5'-phosphate decarboxylase [Candidatus Avimonoglobus intestinipullorum]|uniref:Orotidine 5'-phosphate decarboxylase n=1 Tax=Candidatus Avimonoglobus intestinipullorum TaxID=2840699 RepID=A0A9D1S5W4_9FIRM|nr:orotidine-5'-phosphate decarboxylase [Candidatus Avimonoglobus intestinipullorum]